jgi:superoxide dismutase
MILMIKPIPTLNTNNHTNALSPPNKMMIRHDVIWEHLAPEPSLLNPNFRDRFKETFDSERELYEELTRRLDPP